MFRMRIYRLLTTLAIVTAFVSSSGANTLTFEAPDYVTGQLSGQNGWTNFTDQTPQCAVGPTTTSGLYVGGQAVRFGGSGQSSVLFDLYAGTNGNSFSFDVRSGTGFTTVLGATVAQDFSPSFPDFAPIVGIRDNVFMVRTINRDGSNAISNDYTTQANPLPGGQATTLGNWYRMTVVYQAVTNILSVTAIDLTNGGTPIITGYETISDLLNATNFPTAASRQAYFDSMSYTGVRVGGNGAIDNINSAPVSAAQGDFDMDGDVDGADFIVWQTNYPMNSGATTATGDADNDHDVDGADFAAWQSHFPTTPTPGSSPVPEPSGVAIAVIAILGVLSLRRLKF